MPASTAHCATPGTQSQVTPARANNRRWCGYLGSGVGPWGYRCSYWCPEAPPGGGRADNQRGRRRSNGGEKVQEGQQEGQQQQQEQDEKEQEEQEEEEEEEAAAEHGLWSTRDLKGGVRGCVVSKLL